MADANKLARCNDFIAVYNAITKKTFVIVELDNGKYTVADANDNSKTSCFGFGKYDDLNELSDSLLRRIVSWTRSFDPFWRDSYSDVKPNY